jgi:hypothetical protein
MIAVCRLRCCGRTRAYAERRRAEGKTKTEIIRRLKRYLACELDHALIADLLPQPGASRCSDPIVSSPAPPERSDAPSGPLDIYRNVPARLALGTYHGP